MSLAEVSVPRLLFALLRQRFTGTLHVQQPPPYLGERTVWFRGGMPVYTDWSAPDEVLGRVLITMRLLDEERLLRALEVMAEHGGLLGQHLLSQGLLDRRRLLEGLRQQCSRKLLQLFWLRAGQVRIVPGERGEVDADLLPANVLALVLAGVGTAFDEERIAAELGPILRSGVQATPSFARYRDHFRFRPSDLPLLDALAHGSSWSQLATISEVGPRRSAQLIYALWACQMLRVQAGAPPAEAPPVHMPSATPLQSPSAAAPSPLTPPDGRPSFTSVSSPSQPPLAVAPEPEPATRPRRQTLTDTPIEDAAASAARAGRPKSSQAPVAPEGLLEAFEQELSALEAKVAAGAHAFDLFDLQTDATKRDVRRAWGELSRKFHPDAQRSQGRDYLRERVGAVFAALSEAQQILNDADERAALKEKIERGEHEATKDGKDATAQAHAVFQSELLAKEGDKLLRVNRFDRALERFLEASRYNPEEPDIQAAIAWCEYQVSGKGPDASRLAHARLTEIIEVAPRLARAQYFLGFVLVDQGNPAAAIDAFGKAAQLDPRLIDAQRQQRALKVRLGRPVESVARPSSRQERRGLKGLFGRKK
ncbi:MAG: DnaJ domain-containing protein [Myxococcales bacterium]|nr:DnaJ domain-containing protein [Myxococcales bacterium]